MKRVLFFALAIFFLIPQQLSAHEIYLLPQEEFQKALKLPSHNPFLPLFNQQHLPIILVVTTCTILSFVLVTLFSTTKLSLRLTTFLLSINSYGLVMVRVAIGLSFLFAALQQNIFGPEITLTIIPYGTILLFVLSLLVICGLLTEIAAFIGLLLFSYVSFFHHTYMLTYFAYVGSFLVFCLYGSRFLSLDQYIFKTKKLFPAMKKYEWLTFPILRICFGFAFLYTSYSIKLLHQPIDILFYNYFHLENVFFQADAAFIALGAGIVEILLGLFLILGFFTRFTALVLLFFLSLALVYFQEIVWPHLPLFAIALAVLIHGPDTLSLDTFIHPKLHRFLKNHH